MCTSAETPPQPVPPDAQVGVPLRPHVDDTAIMSRVGVDASTLLRVRLMSCYRHPRLSVASGSVPGVSLVKPAGCCGSSQ